jgi:hypothetical protein
VNPPKSSLVMSDPSWVDELNHPIGPALARAEFDRLEAAILDPALVQRSAGASDHADAVEPPD